MYDEADNLEDDFEADDVSLSEYTGGDDEDESEQWFHDWDYYTYDRDNDDDDDSIRFEYNLKSDSDLMVNVVTVIFKNGDYYDFESEYYWIEDKLKNALAGLSYNMKPLLIAHEYNRTDNSNILRVRNWEEIYGILNG